MKLAIFISLIILASSEIITSFNVATRVELAKKDDASTTVQTTAVTACHFHDDVQFCIDGHGNEGSIVPAPTDKASAPKEYTGCHNHGKEVFCIYKGNEVEFLTNAKDEHEDHDHESPKITEQTSKVTGCHFHGDDQFCIDGKGVEGTIIPPPKDKENAPTEYTGCHSHGDSVFCLHDGKEVEFVTESSNNSQETGKTGKNCHFHAGVEHCVDGDGDEHKDLHCERIDRDYNIPLRIGLLFVILVTSALGSFGPMFLKSMFKLNLEGMIITVIKQFGTGIIISTAFVHLITHAQLLWSNECLAGRVKYEATGTSITMAGIFVAFLIEFIAHRGMKGRATKIELKDAEEAKRNASEQGSIDSSQSLISLHGISSKDKISVTIMEAGIVFHSILIGITLVVAGDTFFITLFIVIVFHQFFEGLALGSRILDMRNTSVTEKVVMSSIFALITPIGMAIGIATLKKFNGNDPYTIIALATLDSFSAGVLLWTGLIEMWSQDWLHGYLSNAPIGKTIMAMIAMVAGMVLMSLLGKWA